MLADRRARRQSGVRLITSILIGTVVGVGSIAYAVLNTPIPVGDIVIDGSMPTVVLVSAQVGPTSVTIIVGDATPAQPLRDFGAILSLNGTGLLGELRVLSQGASNGSMTFQDLDGGGTLTGGDRFVVDTVEPGAYELVLLFRGAMVAVQTWII